MSGLLEQLRGFGTARLAAMAAVGLATLGLIAWMALRAAEPPMALLYGDLDQRDAAQIVAALDRARVPYRLGQGGAQILAPEEQVPRLRLQLARDGLPHGGSVGNELFDRGESLSTTPFQQEMNRVRALEGELARSIRALSGVRNARVHLVLPRREAFSRERGEAQASVVLTMQGAQRLDRDGVQAVLHLVSAAVPGLRPQSISIVDSRGALLARGGQALAGPMAAQTQEELRRGQEMRIARGIEEMLERTMGAGRVRVEAAVEMDFDRVQTTEERFDPDNQVPRSQTSSQEQTRNQEGGNVSVQNNLPGVEAGQGQGGQQESRQEETTNFEIGRTTRNTLREHPVVRRLSVAVLVDGIWEAPEGGGAPRFRERSAEELARLQALVRSAVGFDERRGDRVEVVSLRFADPPEAEPPPAGLFGISAFAISGNTTARLIESAMFAAVALIAILLVVRPMAGKLTAVIMPQPALAAAAAPGAPALPAAPGQSLPAPGGTPAVAGASGAAALPAGETLAIAGAAPGEAAAELISVANIEGQMRASSIAKLHELVEGHPEESLNVVRRWLTPEER